MRSALITSILVAVAFLTSACNTMQGTGQDMQAAGKKLEDSAERNKPKKIAAVLTAQLTKYIVSYNGSSADSSFTRSIYRKRLFIFLPYRFLLLAFLFLLLKV